MLIIHQIEKELQPGAGTEGFVSALLNVLKATSDLGLVTGKQK